MKKVKLVFILGLLSLLSACGNSDSEQFMDVAIVYGNHANMKELPIHQVISDSTVEQTASDGGTIAMISSEQTPRLIANLEVEKIKGGKNTERINRNVNNLLNEIAEASEQSAAQTPEVNLYESILLATKSLSEREESFKKIILIESMLSTDGEIDFIKGGYLHAPAERVVESLVEREAVIDLSSIDEIEIVGLGETAVPQTKLSAKELKNLKQIWERYFEQSGVKKTTFTEVAFTTDIDASKYPVVSNVPTLNTETEELAVSAGNTEAPVVLDETQVKFKPDSAEFVDEAQALQIIQPIAEQIKQNDLKILLIGSTATQGSEEGRLILSEKRANAVAKVLIQSGVSQEQLVSVGCGSTDPWHVTDVIDGKLVEEMAKLNRKIVIADYESSLPEIISIKNNL